MRPIKTPSSNFTYIGRTLDILPLPCRRDNGVVYSTWELSPDERIAIAAGANIELAIYREPVPPVSLAVEIPIYRDEFPITIPRGGGA